MAAITEAQTIAISINDIEVQVPKGELIVESVKRIGLEIPIFCYHPRMKPVGMCRMCIVEVGFKQPDGSIRKMPKPQAACTLPASEGMAIYTDSEMVRRDRKGVLEFLLINHPLDCPICDRGGECPLQNNTLFYGPSTSRFVEAKRHAAKAFPLSSYVTLDLERCIQCGRCVRFTEEISGDSQLAFRFRGAQMQPSTFELTDFTSKFSGNVIEICPVGALTSAKYRFRARPWDLETKPAICTLCSNGCNVWFDYRVGQMVRINGRINETINEEWTCDKGKFGHEFYNFESRLTTPAIRKGDRLSECDWASAYASLIEAFKGKRVAALAGPDLANEDIFLLQRLFRNHFDSNNLDYRYFKHAPRDTEMRAGKDSIQSFEDRSAILLFGTSLAEEEPILYLRVRKAWSLNDAKVIVAHHTRTDADEFAHLVLRYRPGTQRTLAQALAGKVNAADAEAKTGVKAALIEDALKLLSGAPIIATQKVYDLEDGVETVNDLQTLATATSASLNVYALGANHQGAHELGMLPGLLSGHRPVAGKPGLSTDGILKACAAGEIDALWLAHCDPFDLHPDRALVESALEKVSFLVFQSYTVSDAASFASVLLPSCAPAERDGTYTNLERRVQRMSQVIPAKGSAKPGWRIYSELMLRLNPSTPNFSASDVMREIIKEHPGFSNADYSILGEEGTLLP